MKKWVIGLIILVAVLILAIIGFSVYKYYKINSDWNWCMSDKDCEVQFSRCNCDTHCGNTHSGGTDCARECSKEQSKSSVTSCACVRNQCKSTTSSEFEDLKTQKAEIIKENLSIEPTEITILRGANYLKLLSITLVFYNKTDYSNYTIIENLPEALESKEYNVPSPLQSPISVEAYFNFDVSNIGRA